MAEFNFEKLRVYQKAIDFIDKIFLLCDKLPRNVSSSLGYHLRKTSLSIANNIAEGSDKRSAKEKKKFYIYSIDSARECIPMLSVANRRNYFTQVREEELREECAIICKMLNKLINSVKE